MWYTIQGVPAPSFFGQSQWGDDPESAYLKTAVLFSHSFECTDEQSALTDADFARFVDESRRATAEDFEYLAIDTIELTSGSILVIIVVGGAATKLGGIAAVAGLGAWALKTVGGSALKRFGQSIADRAYHALPEAIRGRRFDPQESAAALANKLALDTKCTSAVPVTGGSLVDGWYQYRFSFLPAGCGSVTVWVEPKNQEQPRYST